MDYKAQSGAPFELMVAVIIMAFVIIIGAQVMDSINRNICEDNVRKEVYELKGFLEDSSKALTKVEKLVDQKRCQANCDQPLDSCWVLTFDSRQEKSGSIYIRTCLNLPAFTTFLGPTSNCFEDGFVVVNATEKLPFGQYSLKYDSEGSGDTPRICTLHKYAG